MTKRSFHQITTSTATKTDSTVSKKRHSSECASKSARHKLTKTLISVRQKLTKPCVVTLDAAWKDGVINSCLEAESSVSFRLWLREKKKLEKWKVSNVTFPDQRAESGDKIVGQNGNEKLRNSTSKMVAKKKIRCAKERPRQTEKAIAGAKGKEKPNGLLNSETDIRKSNRIKVMNFKEKKKKLVDKKARTARDDDDGGGSDDCKGDSDIDDRSSESEDQDDGGSSDEGRLGSDINQLHGHSPQNKGFF